LTTTPDDPGGTARQDEEMEVDAWLKHALADADERGLAELAPLLESLARAARALRIADWNLSPPDTLEAEPDEDGRAEVAP
jgi:hypothetical protein